MCRTSDQAISKTKKEFVSFFVAWVKLIATVVQWANKKVPVSCFLQDAEAFSH